MSTFVKPLTQFGEAERVTMIFNVFLFFYVLTVSPNLFVCVYKGSGPQSHVQTSSSVPSASCKVVPLTRPRVKHLAVDHNSLWDHILAQKVFRHNFFLKKEKK